MKLPSTAKRVFKGIIFDVYQWRQKMFDGSYETFEMLKRPDTVQVIATDGRHICLARERQPRHPVCHTLCGGRREPSEKPLAAAKRELREEAGLASSDWELLKTWQPYTKMDWTVYLYAARGCRQVGRPKLDAGEKIKLQKVTWKKFLALVTGKNFWSAELSNYILRLMLYDKKELARFKRQIGL